MTEPIGAKEKVELVRDRADLSRARLLQNILPKPRILKAGEPLPPLSHWLHFPTLAPLSALGPDGHPCTGGFIPDTGLPRRMWAGSRVEFLTPIPDGAAMARRSSVMNMTHKTGKSGKLCFVTIEHMIETEKGVCIREEQDLVYREAVSNPPQTVVAVHEAPSEEPDFSETVTPDPVMLFRYSALTYNGHRIHYDRTYATEIEGYDGLVVHGPLIATLLLDLAERYLPEGRIAAYRFRAKRPLFDIRSFKISGRGRPGGVSLWALDPRDKMALSAEASFE